MLEAARFWGKRLIRKISKKVSSYNISKRVHCSIRDYLITNNVQLGATYKISEISTDKYYDGLRAAAKYINASPDEVGMILRKT